MLLATVISPATRWRRSTSRVPARRDGAGLCRLHSPAQLPTARACVQAHVHALVSLRACMHTPVSASMSASASACEGRGPHLRKRNQTLRNGTGSSPNKANHALQNKYIASLTRFGQIQGKITDLRSFQPSDGYGRPNLAGFGKIYIGEISADLDQLWTMFDHFGLISIIVWPASTNSS